MILLIMVAFTYDLYIYTLAFRYLIAITIITIHLLSIGDIPLCNIHFKYVGMRS